MTTEREEIDRLTRELDEAKEQHAAVTLRAETAEADWQAAEQRLAWHPVSEKPEAPGWYVTGAWTYEPMPDGTEHERFVLHCVDQTFVATWAKDFWLGPLPAAPNEAEPT